MAMKHLFPVSMVYSGDVFNAGNYSCLVAEFHLVRLLGFHLVQSYLPTILMVVISWVAFWMDVNAVPGRVTLGITTLLTVSSKATSECIFPFLRLPNSLFFSLFLSMYPSYILMYIYNIYIYK